jgi:Ca2+-binding EF-hand superfamily protein
MRIKKRHPIIIQEVYDSKKIKKIHVPLLMSNSSLSTYTPTLQNQIDIKRYMNFSNLSLSKSNSSTIASNNSMSSSRSSIIKKLIISEKIMPYQLNMEKTSLLNASSSSSSVGSKMCTAKKSVTLLKMSSSSMDHYFDSFIEDDEQRVNNYENEEEDDYGEEEEASEREKELTEDDVEFLLANTGFNLEQIQRWYVEFKLKCARCLIEYDQFKIYYKSMLPEYLDHAKKERLIRNLFRLFDIDADGYLNFTEFLVSFWIRFKAPIDEKFTWLFNMFDLDRNGYLNQSEMTSAMSLCLNLDDLDRLLDTLKSDCQKIAKNGRGGRKVRRPAVYRQFDKDSLIDAEDDSESGDSFNEEDSEDSDLFFEQNEMCSRNRSGKSVEEKINECMILMGLICRDHRESTAQNSDHENEENINNDTNEEWMLFRDRLNSMGGDASSQFFYKNSTGYYNYLSSSSSNWMYQLRRVQFTRENFLFLCEKYKSLRKLLLPIKCFYDDSNNSKQ